MNKETVNNEAGIKSAKDQCVKGSSIFDQSDFKIRDIIQSGRSEEEYLTDYCRLVDYALQRGLDKSRIRGYYEKHHIFPKCVEGEDSDYNYVLLTYREHVIAHILLYKLFPDNLKLTAAAIMMTNSKSKDNLETNIRTEFFDQLIDIISEMKQEFKEHIEKSIVCHDKFYNVCKIYNRLSDVEKDGFLISKVSCVANGKRKTTGGYYWTFLTKFEKTYPNKILDYKNHTPNISLKPIDTVTKRVVCIDPNNNSPIKIYERVKDTEIDGFIPKLISAALNGKKQKSSGGYIWKYYEEYIKECSPEEIKEFNDQSIKVSPIILEDKRVVCYDRFYNVLKIYTSFNNVKVDNFDIGSIKNTVNSSSKFYGGYYWDTYTHFIIDNEDKIHNYEKNPIQITITRQYWKYICLDMDTKNILKVYKCNSDVIKDGFSVSSVIRTINGYNKSSGGYFWMRYSDFEQQYPGRLEEYLENHKDNN